MTAALQSHPPSIDLEAFACGEPNDDVAAHVATCDSCKAFTTEIESSSKTFANDTHVDAIIAAAVRVSDETEAREPGQSDVPVPTPINVRVLEPEATPIRRLDTALRVLPFLAMAAGVLLWMRLAADVTPDTHPRVSPPAATNGAANGGQLNTDTTGTAFKGGTQLAVIRERDGVQKRFTGEVTVRKGDRLRIEVALDHSANILGGVLAEDGTFLDLLHEGDRGNGTFYSEEAARFDDSPTRGYVIVGPKDAVLHARAAIVHPAGSGPEGMFGEGITTLRVVWASEDRP